MRISLNFLLIWLFIALRSLPSQYFTNIFSILSRYHMNNPIHSIRIIYTVPLSILQSANKLLMPVDLQPAFMHPKIRILQREDIINIQEQDTSDTMQNQTKWDKPDCNLNQHIIYIDGIVIHEDRLIYISLQQSLANISLYKQRTKA